MRFLSLGDSYTIGEGVPQNDSWPFQLVAALRQNGLLVEDPIVIAKTGWTTGELQEAIARENPQGPFDLITLLIGVNNQYRGLPLDQFEKDLRELLACASSILGERGQVFVLSIPDWTITPFANGRNTSEIAGQIESYNRAAKTISQQEGVAFVEVTDISRQAAEDMSLLAGDGLHPSAAMYALWVQKLLPLAWRVLKNTD